MKSDANTPSIDQLRAMLRFYLQWPGMPANADEHESEHFFDWLVDDMGLQEADDIAGGLAGIRYFIDNNTNVLTRAKHLKSGKSSLVAGGNGRENDRIPINTQMFSLIYDCTKDPDLEGKVLRGILLDIAQNGMRIETNVPVPGGSILSITVAKFSSDTELYNLTGEVRWLTEHAEAYHAGISIFSIEDYKEWGGFFHALQRTW